jgi:hypothetical protein
LKKAVKLIEEDGNYFMDLKQAVEKRIALIDPKSVPKDFNSINNVSTEQK